MYLASQGRSSTREYRSRKLVRYVLAALSALSPRLTVFGASRNRFSTSLWPLRSRQNVPAASVSEGPMSAMSATSATRNDRRRDGNRMALRRRQQVARINGDRTATTGDDTTVCSVLLPRRISIMIRILLYYGCPSMDDRDDNVSGFFFFFVFCFFLLPFPHRFHTHTHTVTYRTRWSGIALSMFFFLLLFLLCCFILIKS